MKRLRHSRASRWTARLLVLAFLLPTFYVGAGVRSARAQVGVPIVYVLDFNNNTTLGGALLGRRAAAWTSLTLIDSGNWDVIPEARVQERVQTLDLRPPFDQGDRAQIAEGVNATAVVYGWIEEARVTADPTQAHVTLRMVVEDVDNGVLLNGAVATGESQVRVGFAGDADVLLEEALRRATFQAVQEMDRFQLPTGTILNTWVSGDADQNALLNVGIRQGATRGMDFVVLRLGEAVGRVRAIKVDSDLTNARITDNYSGVKPEDRVRAIFTFEHFRRTPRNRRVDARTLPSDQVRLYAEAGPIEAFVASNEELDTAFFGANGDQVPPAVVVENPEPARRTGGFLSGAALQMLTGGALLVGILAVGGTSKTSTRPHAADARAIQFGPGNATGLEVTWSRPRRIPSIDILQYIVWRSQPNSMDPFQIAGANMGDFRVFRDTSTEPMVWENIFDGAPGPGFDNSAGSQNDFDVPGLLFGNHYRYKVATAWFFRGDSDVGPGPPFTPDDEELMGPFSNTSPRATFLLPPTILEPETTVPLTEVNPDGFSVRYETVDGADRYALLISSEPTFRDGNTMVFGTQQHAPPPFGPAEATFTEVRVTNRRIREQGIVFLAIGARNSNDRHLPKQVGPSRDGWILSGPVQVDLFGIEPPPAPGAVGRAARGGGGR